MNKRFKSNEEGFGPRTGCRGRAGAPMRGFAEGGGHGEFPSGPDGRDFPGGGHHGGPRGGPGGRGEGPEVTRETRGRGRGRSRARRGDVRWALLSLIEEQPSNGYGLMKRMEEKTEGAWRSSPGSVYPTLAQLVDEGLLATIDNEDGKAEYMLTDAGRAYVDEHRERIAKVWASVEGGESGVGEMMEALHSAMAAAKQIGRFGTAGQRAAATEKLVALRKDLYRILAD